MSDERFEGDENLEEEGGEAPEGADGETPDGAEGETPDADEAPAPATWAGRQAWSGLPDSEGAEAGEIAAESGDSDAEDADPDEGTGLTDEFGDLETELAGEHELPALDNDATADEGPEPGDEFDFDEEEEAADHEPAEPVEDAEDDSGQHTIEADTTAIADREEAGEAALQGLRDRTKEHVAKRGVTDPGMAPAPVEAKPVPADAGAPEGAAGEPAPATAVPAATAAGAAAAAAAAATPPAAPGPGPGLADEKPPRAGVWARFMAASFLIIASMAAATAVSLLVYLTDIAEGLGGLPGIVDQLDQVDEDAQNFLILGSDVRPGQTSKGLSDTTMLLRVDPPNNLISQLSIPRDLRVSIPGHGIDKFNAAYSYGGPSLTLKVVKQITDDRIPINHVVNVDFTGFADAVDAIGCVYMDVDRHYFHSNEGVGFADQYAEIDIQAGYQRLCGLKALQYVRYRHEDNDIVRAARQQGFLREARQKVPPEKLYEDRTELIDIFTKYTTSDIEDSGTLVGLFKLMIDARAAQISQIEFPFSSLDEEGYVTASDAPLQDAVSKFLGETPTAPPTPPEESGGGGPKPGGGEPQRKPDPKSKPEGDPEQTPEQAAAASMIDSTAAGQLYTAAIREQGGNALKFPVLYPTRQPASSTISDDTRYFGIDGGGDKLYHGYKFVMTYPGTTYNPAYYGVSGTDWLGAPLFENPSERRKIGDREFLFFYDSGRLRMVAFERDKAMYWVTNTLDKLLTEPQMIAIAQNLREAGT